jgi:hypothetical protein
MTRKSRSVFTATALAGSAADRCFFLQGAHVSPKPERTMTRIALQLRTRTAHARIAPVALGALSLCALLLGSALAQDSSPVTPDDVIRIGIVQTKVQVGSTDAPQAAESVRSILAQYLRGPTIEVTLLSARLPSQYTLEAQQANCDYILATTLTHRRGSFAATWAPTLARVAGAAPIIPGVDYLSAAVATGVLITAADFAASVKAKDQMQLEYELQAVDAMKPVFLKKDKRRAKADGEDLITPLAENAAEAVGAAISR